MFAKNRVSLEEVVVFLSKRRVANIKPRDGFLIKTVYICSIEYLEIPSTRLKWSKYFAFEKGNVHSVPLVLHNSRSNFCSSCPTNNFRAHAR